MPEGFFTKLNRFYDPAHAGVFETTGPLHRTTADTESVVHTGDYQRKAVHRRERTGLFRKTGWGDLDRTRGLGSALTSPDIVVAWSPSFHVTSLPSTPHGTTDSRPELGSVTASDPFGPSVGHAVPLGYEAYAVAPIPNDATPNTPATTALAVLELLLDALGPYTGQQPVHFAMWDGRVRVLLSDVDEQATAAAVADRIATSLSAPFDIDGRLHVAPASVGLYVTDGLGCTPESLLSAADRGMYADKRASRADSGDPPSPDASETAERSA